MRWAGVTGFKTLLHTSLVVLISTTLLMSTTQGRVVVSSKDLTSSSSHDHDGKVIDLLQEGFDEYTATTSDEEFDDDTDDVDDDGDDDMDLWPVLCPANTFFDLEKDKCITCSKCPINTLIEKPCHRFDDNLCMPLYGPIASFNSGTDGRSSSSSSSSTSSNKDSNNSQRKNSKYYNNRNNKNKQYNNRQSINNNKNKNKNRTVHPSEPSVSDNSFEWKSVALVMLVCSAVIFICLVSLSAVFCYLRRRALNTGVTKEIVCKYGPAPKLPPIVEVAAAV